MPGYFTKSLAVASTQLAHTATAFIHVGKNVKLTCFAHPSTTLKMCLEQIHGFRPSYSAPTSFSTNCVKYPSLEYAFSILIRQPHDANGLKMWAESLDCLYSTHIWHINFEGDSYAVFAPWKVPSVQANFRRSASDLSVLLFSVSQMCDTLAYRPHNKWMTWTSFTHVSI